MRPKDLENYIIGKRVTITEAMQKIDINSWGIVFVVDESERLCGAVSDGDIRRWLLNGGGLTTEVHEMMHVPALSVESEDKNLARQIMNERSVNVIPYVDDKKCIKDIYFLADKLSMTIEEKEALRNVPVIIMAGGKGTRLYPYTKILPKPLIPIGEIPIVERVIEGFNKYGVVDFYMTVNYKKNMIESYFADEPKEYNLTFVEEDKPLGTGGSIRLVKHKFDTPIIIANCDSLIRTDFYELYCHHMDSKNDITMVTSIKNDTIPYGVIYSACDGTIDHMVEKPTNSYLINTGMYIINPDMISLIPEDTIFHMTDLVEAAMKKGYQVGMYPVSEDSFLDMGEFEEMKRMEEKLRL